MPIKIIDLFAGPGGLGEGFSSYRPNGKQAFKIAISIEKETSAHRTLLLRALYRQYDPKAVPEAYYAFLRGELGTHPEDELYRLPELKKQLSAARREAQQMTLGEESPRTVYSKIRNAVGRDECILIGGPPCQAYSLVGRSRNYGAKDKKYSASDDHRNFLYLEYLKIIAKFQPKLFVMENVKGMLSAKVNGELIFNSIRQDLADPYKATKVEPDIGRKRHRYNIFSFSPKTGSLDWMNEDEGPLDPHDFIIRTENHGIPQARHRVILLGVREDISPETGKTPLLKPSNENPTVQQAISDLPQLRSRLSKGKDTTENWREAIQNLNNSTLNKLINDPLTSRDICKNLSQRIKNIQYSPGSTGADKGLLKESTVFDTLLPKSLKTWYRDPRLGKYVVNHTSRGHIVGDLHRYLYYSTYAQMIGTSPTAKNLPKALWPGHKNFSSGKFADRFRVQLSEKPGTTVTSHISKDGHYFIHYDPSQCRSLTVREAARIQTFPDNYYFVGSRTEQYVQVGNAVPPYLAKQLATVISKILN